MPSFRQLFICLLLILPVITLAQVNFTSLTDAELQQLIGSTTAELKKLDKNLNSVLGTSSTKSDTNCTIVSPIIQREGGLLIYDVPSGCPMPLDDLSNVSITTTGAYSCNGQGSYSDYVATLLHNPARIPHYS